MGFLYEFKDSEKVVFLKDGVFPKLKIHQDEVQQVSGKLAKPTFSKPSNTLFIGMPIS